MKTRNTTTKLIATMIAVGTLAAICSTWGALRTEAVPRSCGGCGAHSGMFGVARGQTARMNVVNTGEERGFIIEGGKFLDSDGNTLVEFRGPINLPPGQATFFDFDANAFIIDGSRVEVRAVVNFGGQRGSTKEEDVLSTIEVLENDASKTTVLIGVDSGSRPE